MEIDLHVATLITGNIALVTMVVVDKDVPTLVTTDGTMIQGHNQVYGIRDHSPGIGIIDPGSRVTSHGIRISHFLCVSLRDQGSSFSDTSLLMRN